jgi:hypothetical protein
VAVKSQKQWSRAILEPGTLAHQPNPKPEIAGIKDFSDLYHIDL